MRVFMPVRESNHTQLFSMAVMSKRVRCLER